MHYLANSRTTANKVAIVEQNIAVYSPIKMLSFVSIFDIFTLNFVILFNY
ncbi:hypothetical protein ABSA28_01154 [Candidatus Hepatincolaceae symbiont of Richtersius coronifer]